MKPAIQIPRPDNWGNLKPVQIEENEWWFNGHIIQKQTDCRLPTWRSFPDSQSQSPAMVHGSRREATEFCLNNPVDVSEVIHTHRDY